MELAVGVTIRQLFLYVNYSSSFKAPGHKSVFPGE